MKVICDRSSLLEAVNLVSSVAATRSPRLQLTCVHLIASNSGDGSHLDLQATDADISLSIRLHQVEVQEPGNSLIPADKLRQIISAEDNESTLTLQAKNQDLTITGNDAHFKILGHDPQEFPTIPQFSTTIAENSASLKTTMSQQAGELATIISRTLFATARENSRYAINGVLFRSEGKYMEMVATDGRRLALSRTSTASNNDSAVSCIIPTKALALLQKIIHEPEEPIQIAITENQILFCFGDSPQDSHATLCSNLVEGTFPPYEDVIPKDQDKKITFQKDLLSSAVKRAALLTNEESRGVRLAFNADKKTLELSSRAPEMGEARVSLELNDYEGDDIEIGFNPAFITDALRVLPDQQVVMELKAANKPGLIKAGNDFVYVIMPVNLQ